MNHKDREKLKGQKYIENSDNWADYGKTNKINQAALQIHEKIL